MCLILESTVALTEQPLVMKGNNAESTVTILNFFFPSGGADCVIQTLSALAWAFIINISDFYPGALIDHNWHS